MMKKAYPLLVSLAVIAAMVGYFLGRGGLSPASAQGMVSEQGNTIVVVGPEKNSRLPIIVVDTREQTMCLYRYDYNGNNLELAIARSYQWDKKLEQLGRQSPDISSVRKEIMKK